MRRLGPSTILLLAAATLAAPAPARGIVLGGRRVARSRFIVYLFIGHSNMAGRDARRADIVPHARCWNYRWYADERWVPAVETRHGHRGLTPRGSGGPGMPFLKQLAERHARYWFGIIQNAESAARAREGHLNYMKGSRLYNEIITAALAVKPDVTFGGIVCMLGINERNSEPFARSFAEDIYRIVTDMRKDLGEPKLPFLIGQYEASSTGGYDPRRAFGPVIIQQIYAIPRKLEYAAVVDSRGVPCVDDHHYTVQGHVEWTRRALDLLAKNKWFPPPGAARRTPWRPRSRPATTRPRKPYVPPPDPDTWPVSRNGLIFLWENAKARNWITDPARGKPRPCRLTGHGRAVLGPHYDMDVSGGSFIAQDADDEVIFEACRKADQLTLEALILSDRADQRDAYIISFVPEKGRENFALLQDGEDLLLKIIVGEATLRPLSFRLGELTPGEARHVLVSFVGGLLTCYVNGRQVAVRRDIRGGFDNWRPGRLVFGDGWGGGHDWHGRIEGVAIYSRHVGERTARWKSNLYRDAFVKRPPRRPVRMTARLIARSTPAEHTGVYGKALILYRYAVEHVESGTYPHKTVQVLHWGGLDDKPIHEILRRKVGRTCTLVVEPAEQHPQIATETVGADAEDLDLPRYCDIARPLK
jgi:hypothetical protein